MGHKRHVANSGPMSALPPKADMVQYDRDVRFVPKADIQAALGYVFEVRPGKLLGDVRIWHKADIGTVLIHVRFWG